MKFILFFLSFNFIIFNVSAATECDKHYDSLRFLDTSYNEYLETHSSTVGRRGYEEQVEEVSRLLKMDLNFEEEDQLLDLITPFAKKFRDSVDIQDYSKALYSSFNKKGTKDLQRVYENEVKRLKTSAMEQFTNLAKDIFPELSYSNEIRTRAEMKIDDSNRMVLRVSLEAVKRSWWRPEVWTPILSIKIILQNTTDYATVYLPDYLVSTDITHHEVYSITGHHLPLFHPNGTYGTRPIENYISKPELARIKPDANGTYGISTTHLKSKYEFAQENFPASIVKCVK